MNFSSPGDSYLLFRRIHFLMKCFKFICLVSSSQLNVLLVTMESQMVLESLALMALTSQMKEVQSVSTVHIDVLKPKLERL